VDLPIPGRRPIRISRYLVARGEDRSLVFYWYQSRGRVVGGEFAAKFWLVADAIRYRRSDTALVRVVVPVAGAAEAAEREATGFIQASFSPLLRALSPVP
jgi:EpsI family protein